MIFSTEYRARTRSEPGSMPFRGTWELSGNHSSIICPFWRRFNWQRMNTDGKRGRARSDGRNIATEKGRRVLTDVALFALFRFVAQADLKSVDFTRQVAEMTKDFFMQLSRQTGESRCVTDLLEDEFLSENGVLALPGVRLGHLDTIQVDVTVGTGEILDWQLVGLLHIQHQAAHLRVEQDKQCPVYWDVLTRNKINFSVRCKNDTACVHRLTPV